MLPNCDDIAEGYYRSVLEKTNATSRKILEAMVLSVECYCSK